VTCGRQRTGGQHGAETWGHCAKAGRRHMVKDSEEMGVHGEMFWRGERGTR
jgi:hypothetical protein